MENLVTSNGAFFYVIITCYKYPRRLACALCSFLLQKYSQYKVWIITPNQKQDIMQWIPKEVWSSNKFTFIKVSNKLWNNKGAMNNIGLDCAEKDARKKGLLPFVMFTDADMVWPGYFLFRVNELWATDKFGLSEKTFASCWRYTLSEQTSKALIDSCKDVGSLFESKKYVRHLRVERHLTFRGYCQIYRMDLKPPPRYPYDRIGYFSDWDPFAKSFEQNSFCMFNLSDMDQEMVGYHLWHPIFGEHNNWAGIEEDVVL